MKRNSYNRGQSLVGIIIVLVLVAAGLFAGGLYYSKQTSETPEITEKSSGEETINPEEELSKEEIIPKEKIEENSIPQKEEKPVVQKCTDGTSYGQCSVNKPKYCSNGVLSDDSSLCGCPLGYKVSGVGCVKQPSTEAQEKCLSIYEGNPDHSQAIDVIIIGADDSFSGKGYKYSNKTQNFVSDATTFANEFLSTPPFNNYKNNFNFYYSPKIINCTSAPFGFGSVGGTKACKEWQEAVNLCSIKHDVAAVLVNAGLQNIHTFGNNYYSVSPSGETSENNTVFSEQSSPVLIHEIGHISFNLVDEYGAGNNKGPNVYFGLESTGKPLCRIKKDPNNPSNSYYEETVPTEVSGGTCAYQLRYFGGGYSPLYVTNEKSIMKAGADEKKKGFSLLGEQYLKNALSRIAQIGYESWLPEKAKWEVFPTDQIPTVSVSDPPTARAGETATVTVSGNDNIGIRSLRMLNFGDATYADYQCNGTPGTCTYTFTHTYTSSGTYYGRVQTIDSLGQGSTHKDFTIKISN